MSDDAAFYGLAVPAGNDRRELYKSQYRAIYTFKMSAQDLDSAFRDAVTSEGPHGSWSINNDERVKYVGKLEVKKGDDVLKVGGRLAVSLPTDPAWPPSRTLDAARLPERGHWLRPLAALTCAVHSSSTSGGARAVLTWHPAAGFR